MKYPLARLNPYTLVALFALALLPRAVHLFFISSTPLFEPPFGDSATYIDLAWRHLNEGFFYNDVYSTSSIVYVYFLAVLFTLFGENHVLIAVIQIILGSLNCVLIFLVARMLFPERVAVVASIAAAFYGTLIFFDGELLAATLVLFFCNLFFLFLIRMRDSGSWRDAFPAGLFCALAVLGSPNIILVLPFLALWVLTLARGRKSMVLCGVFLLGFLLGVAPAPVKNYFSSGDFVFISSNGGINFYIGNNPRASGSFYLPEGRGLQNTRDFNAATYLYPERVTGKKLKASEVSAFWYAEAFRFMGENPLLELSLLLDKTALFFNAHETPNHNNFQFMKRFSPVLWMAPFGFGLVVPFAILGAALSLADWRRHTPLYIFFCVYAVSVIAFFVTARYRLPVLPVFIIFASSGAWWVFDKLRERDFKPALVALLPLTALFIGVNWEIDRFEEDAGFAMNHAMVGQAYLKKGELQEAESSFREAAKISPENADYHYMLGVILLRGGDTPAATSEFYSALEVKKGHSWAHYELGNIHLAGGELAAAASEYEAARRGNGNFAAAYLKLARVYAALGRNELSMRYTRKGIALSGRARPR